MFCAKGKIFTGVNSKQTNLLPTAAAKSKQNNIISVTNHIPVITRIKEKIYDPQDLLLPLKKYPAGYVPTANHSK